VLGVVSSLVVLVGFSSQVAFGQRITVSDFEFDDESVQEVGVALTPGRLEDGQWVDATIDVIARGHSFLPYEAVLSVYSADGEEPLFTKIMKDRPLIQPYDPIAVILGTVEGHGTKPPYSTSIYPPPFPYIYGYTADLSDSTLPDGLPAGAYVAQVDFYYVTDGFPEGPEWSPWQYGTVRGLYSKLVGSTGVNFNIAQKSIDLAKMVEVKTTVSATTIPAPRSNLGARNRLLNHAKNQVNLAIGTAKGGLQGLAPTYNVSPDSQWLILDGGGDRIGLSKSLLLYAYTYNNKLADFAGAVGAGTTFNKSTRIAFPEGVVVVNTVTAFKTQ